MLVKILIPYVLALRRNAFQIKTAKKRAHRSIVTSKNVPLRTTTVRTVLFDRSENINENVRETENYLGNTAGRTAPPVVQTTTKTTPGNKYKCGSLFSPRK